MSAILFASTRPRQSRHSAHFAAGVFVQRGPKLPIGPAISDARWAAENLNRTADASDDEWADEFDRRTLSRDEFLSLSYEIEQDRLDRQRNADEAEIVQACGSQVGHNDAPEPSFADELLAAVLADVKPAKPRKPRPRTLRQINRARIAAEKAAKGGAL